MALVLHRLLACIAFCAVGAAAAPAEPPFVGDPVEVSAEKRLELAFREVQLGLERNRSDRAEDADLIVCMKQKRTGSHLPVIECATNRYWSIMRTASLSRGLAVEGAGPPAMGPGMNFGINPTGADAGRTGVTAAGVTGSNGAKKRADDKVVSMTLSDYNRLKQRFGELPVELRATQAAGRR